MLIAQSCPTFYDPKDCSPAGFSMQRNFQERIVEWLAISYSRGSSWHRDWTQASCTACRFFTIWATLSNKWINEWMGYFDCHLEPTRTGSLEFAVKHFCLLLCVIKKFFFFFLPREHTGHSKHLFPTTQEMTLHMDITRRSISESDWLCSLQPKMEKLYTVSTYQTWT